MALQLQPHKVFKLHSLRLEGLASKSPLRIPCSSAHDFICTSSTVTRFGGSGKAENTLRHCQRLRANPSI